MKLTNSYKNIFYIVPFVFLIMLFVFFSPNLISNDNTNHKNETNDPEFTMKLSGGWNLSHIHINNNWSLTEQEEWCYKMNGVYIIENVSLDAENEGHGILIENSTEPFMIRNCIIINSGPGLDASGIFLFNTSHGLIYNNSILENSRGIYLYGQSINNTISENKILNCSGSIKLENRCNENKIKDNILHNNSDGIYLIAECCQNVITDNQLSENGWGIILSDDPFDSLLSSDRNIIKDNKIRNSKIDGNGITIYDCSHNLILNNEIINCTGTNELRGNGIMFDSSSMISTISQNNSIIGNRIQGNNNGIQSFTISGKAYNNTLIFNNTFIHNENEAIDITYHDYLNVSNNRIEKNGKYNALTLSYGVFCYFYNNKISNNFMTGATISVYENLTLLNNHFENNSLGLYASKIDRAIISNNTFLNNSWMAGWFDDLIYLEISNNHFRFNKYGLNITIDSYAILSKNIFSDNIEGGLWINNNDAQIYLINNYIWKNGNSNFEDQVSIIGGYCFLINNTIGHTMDTDQDGLSDYDEITTHFTNHFNIDTDMDNLNDAFELKYGTDPCDDDSDDDGYFDGIEILSNTNPLDPNDYPGNGANNNSDPFLLGYIIMISGAIIITGIVSTILYIKIKK